MPINDPKQLDIELFRITNKLNLSDRYESIPKEVSPRDKSISRCENNRLITNTYETVFHLDKIPFKVSITPATIKYKNDKRMNVSRYPFITETKVEYAILSIATRNLDSLRKAGKDAPVLVVRTTIYEIKKEIARAINKCRAEDCAARIKELHTEGKKMSSTERKSYEPVLPNNVYTNQQITDALDILMNTAYQVDSFDGKQRYKFKRINSYGADDNEKGTKLLIELGSQVAEYINSSSWRPVEGHNLIGSYSYYAIRLRSLLYNRFVYANRKNKYNPGLDLLLEHTTYPEMRSKKETANKLVDILESLKEVRKVVLDVKKEGRKVVNIIFNIYASDYFINAQVEANNLLQENERAVFFNGHLLVKPLESSYDRREDYKADLEEYIKEFAEYHKNIANNEIMAVRGELADKKD